MGFGINPWDLISQSQAVDPEEERRRRMMEEMSQPVEDVGEQQPFDDEVPPPEIIQAPRVLGSASPETSDILGAYKDWMARRPDREALRPSTGRKILGGVAGFLAGLGGGPGAASAISHDIVHGKYEGALSDWEEEGKTLGDVGKFAQDVSETRRKKEADVLGYEGVQARVEQQRQGVEQRREAENLRHTDRMSSITGDNERRGEIARHNKVLEGIATESNRIRGVEAATGARGAATGEANVGLRKEELGLKKRELERKEAMPGRPKPAHYQAAVHDAISEMMPSHPEMKKLLKYDAKNRKWSINQPSAGVLGMGGREITPQDMNNIKYFMDEARKKADRNLGIGPGGIPPEDEETVDEYSPLREDF